MSRARKQPAGLARAREQRVATTLEARKVAALERIAASLETIHQRICIFVQRPAVPVEQRGTTPAKKGSNDR